MMFDWKRTKGIALLIAVIIICLTAPSSFAEAINVEDNFILSIGDCTYIENEVACKITEGLDNIEVGYTAVKASNFWMLYYRTSEAANGVFAWGISEKDFHNIAFIMSDSPEEPCFCLAGDTALAYIPNADIEIEGWIHFDNKDSFIKEVLLLN